MKCWPRKKIPPIRSSPAIMLSARAESAQQILDRLVPGMADATVTIPEGRNISEFAEILEEKNVCDAAAFYRGN